jgi:hypothetical protein
MKATKKSFSEKSKKTKKRGPFLIPKPIPISEKRQNMAMGAILAYVRHL